MGLVGLGIRGCVMRVWRFGEALVGLKEDL